MPKLSVDDIAIYAFSCKRKEGSECGSTIHWGFPVLQYYLLWCLSEPFGRNVGSSKNISNNETLDCPFHRFCIMLHYYDILLLSASVNVIPKLFVTICRKFLFHVKMSNSYITQFLFIICQYQIIRSVIVLFFVF